MAELSNPYLYHDKADVTTQASLLDNVTEGVLVRTGDEVVFANKAIFDILGADFNDVDLLSRTIDEWIHPADRQKIEDTFRGRIDGKDVSSSYEFRLIRLDGSELWVSCRAALIEWAGQVSAVAYLTDISADIESRNKQQLSNDLFKNIFTVTPEFMLLFGLSDTRVIGVNPAFLNIFGYRKDMVEGLEVGTLELWSEPTFFGRFIEELKTTASLTDIPAALKTRGGVIRHFRLFARRIDGAGEPLLLMTGRDVTEEISRAQELQRTRDAAELSNRTKSEFLANMSHELRTPLNAILGFSELIRDNVGGASLAAKHTEYASDIHNSGQHLLSIINDILDLSKVEAGRMDAHIRRVDPMPCLEMCLRLIQQRATQGEVTITRDLDESLLVEADDRLLKQIVLNLLSNAVKFTKAGGSVSLTFKSVKDGGACLTVSDTGIGMTAADIAIAKRPFGQVDSGLSRAHQGSGLGLPLVVAFVEKLNAKLTIESEPDAGTRVRVFFPASSIHRRSIELPQAANA